MSVLHCEVILDNQKTVYGPGDKLSGRVILTLDVRLLLKAVFMEYTGFADVQWQTPKKTKKSEKNKNGQQRLEVYTNREDFLSTLNFFVGSEEATPRIIERGTYVYPFSVALPAHCPSSFESPNGHIRYLIEVFIDHKNKRELRYSQKLNVLKPLDLRYVSQLTTQPYEVRVEENVFFKIFKEPMQMLVALQQNGFVPGELLSAHISIHNPRKLKLHELSYELLRVLCITASHGHKKTKTKYFQTILAKSVHSFCGARELMAQHLQTIWVPQTSPTTDPVDCRCLQISYELHVRLCTVHAKVWLDAKVPITVGTLPLQHGGMRQATQEAQWQQKLAMRSMVDLSTSGMPFEVEGSHMASGRERLSDIVGASAPSPEIRERSMSMISLASSSFREAEYMAKTKFDDEQKKRKHKSDETDFKPRYLYYDLNSSPEEDVENAEEISGVDPESEQNGRSTLANNAYAGVLQQLSRQMQARKPSTISEESIE